MNRVWRAGVGTRWHPALPGIAAVSVRLANGTLRILDSACPNPLAEAALCRWSAEREERRAEVPVDENNHALAALRYLVSKLDERLMGGAKARRAKEEEAARGQQQKRPWLTIHNEQL